MDQPARKVMVLKPKCEWNDTVCVPVSLVKDVELEFKFRGRCHKLVEDVEFSKQIHINGLLMQTCTNRDNSFLISFQGVMFTRLYIQIVLKTLKKYY